MLTLSLDIPAVQRRAERENDDTINDPLSILIAAEEELEFEPSAGVGCSFPQCYIPCKLCGSKK